ncbi:MAG: hypothetical protein MJZ22_05600 [Candidatus Saccharibacteria bacterium]|nr:hypothetical protein [Candidatus Saccharibacteria bacterium]
MKTYNIISLYGGAWLNAIENAAKVINDCLGINLTAREDWQKVQDLCSKMNLLFDENGNL